MMAFSYIEPANIHEALSMLAQYGDEARPIAGGTGLINLMKQQLVQPAYLVGLRRLNDLKALTCSTLTPEPGKGEPAIRSASDESAAPESSDGDGLTLGSLCTLRTLETSPLIRQQAPLLAEACRRVATIRIRSMATLGGALAHADPSEDLPPAMIAMDARVRLRSHRGSRELPVAELFTGYYETVIEPDELVAEVAIPMQSPDTGTAFIKFLPQTQDDYATVAVAVRVGLQADRISEVRVALGAVAPTPLRARDLEEQLCGQAPTPMILSDAAELVAGIVDPISDFRGSADYKREMAVVFTRRALMQAVAVAQGGGAA
jgi:aerobic carbon-monoxide dehydrogenase medium subunit